MSRSSLVRSDSFVRSVVRIGDRGLTIVGRIPDRLVEYLGLYLAADTLLRPVVEGGLPSASAVLKWFGVAAAALVILAKPVASGLKRLLLMALPRFIYWAVYERDVILLVAALDSSTEAERVSRLTSMLRDKVRIQNAEMVAEELARRYRPERS